MSAYPDVPNNISRVERSQRTEEMNPFRVREAAGRHLAGQHQQRTPVAPQYQAAPSQPSNPYEQFCFPPALARSYTPVTRPMHPAPLIPKGYAELATAETSWPAQTYGTFQDPCSQGQWNVPRSLIPGYEPLTQLEAYHSQALETPPVSQPLRRSARNKASAQQCNQDENSQVQSRRPNVRLTQAERTHEVRAHSQALALTQAERRQEVRAHSQALVSRVANFEAMEAQEWRQDLEQPSTVSYGQSLSQAWQGQEWRQDLEQSSMIDYGQNLGQAWQAQEWRQDLEQPSMINYGQNLGQAWQAQEWRQDSEQPSTMSYGQNLGQAWQASRNKGDATDPSVTISNINKANARILLWLQKVEGAAFE